MSSEPEGAGRRRSPWLGPALLLTLLGFVLLAAGWVYHARTPDLGIEVIQLTRHVTPDDDGDRDRMRVAFYVRFDEPAATIEIIGKRKRLIWPLAGPISLASGQRVVCLWDGRSYKGWRASDENSYRLRVTLPGQDRVMIFPRRVYLEVPKDEAVTELDNGCELVT